MPTNCVCVKLQSCFRFTKPFYRQVDKAKAEKIKTWTKEFCEPPTPQHRTIVSELQQ